MSAKAVAIHSPIEFLRRLRRCGVAVWLPVLALLLVSAGCKRLRHEQHDKVYVWVRQMYLRDRVAAVSNRVAQVENGQELELLEHGRRFLRVKTEKNEIGWIEERAVIDAKTHDAFSQLAEQHKAAPVVSSGTVRDDVYLHLKPGRDSDRFYLLAANARVQLLERASVLKAAVPGAVPAPAAAAAGKNSAPSPQSKAAPPPAAEPTPEPPPMEDWWLVRDAKGHYGWLLSGRVDVDVPDEIGTYAEGQRIVGAYALDKITDPEAQTPNHEVTEYVTILSPPKAGLPFDFDQVRVFVWSMRHHRYETAFRLHPIQGFLPFVAGNQPTASGSLPGFSFQLASDSSVITDPETGVNRPAHPRTVAFFLQGQRIQRTGADQGPIPVSHLAESQPKNDKKAKAAKGKHK